MQHQVQQLVHLWGDIYGSKPMPDPRPLVEVLKDPADESSFLAALAQYRGDPGAVLLLIAAASKCEDKTKLNSLARLASKLVPNRAGTDPLTGLLDHGASWQALQREWDRANRHGRSLTLVVVDLAGFKQVNDTIGHINGDRLLKRIAELLQRHARVSDIVGRIGGDEFMIIMSDADEEAGHEIMRRVRIHLGPLKRDGVVPEVFDMSYGVSSYHISGPATMFQQAEAGLYSTRGKALSNNNPVNLPRVSVLVVEDDFALASLVEEILKSQGYSVSAAYSLAQAREKLEEGLPDLLVLDLGLPDGSGWNLLQAHAHGDVPVIVTTGYRSEGELAQAEALGVFDYLVKPYSPEALQQSVERVLLLRAGS